VVGWSKREGISWLALATLKPECERGCLILTTHEASYCGCKSPSLVVLETMWQGLYGEIVHDDGGVAVRLQSMGDYFQFGSVFIKKKL